MKEMYSCIVQVLHMLLRLPSDCLVYFFCSICFCLGDDNAQRVQFIQFTVSSSCLGASQYFPPPPTLFYSPLLGGELPLRTPSPSLQV